MTIVYRRSNRSAMTPAIGPRNSAGSRRMAIVPPNTAPCAALPLTCDEANRAVASRPIQSPNDAAPSTSHSRRNGRMRSTDRSAAVMERSTGAELVSVSMAIPPVLPTGALYRAVQLIAGTHRRRTHK
jgi:hypothetical protein